MNELPLLQKRLIMSRYFCSLFGSSEFRDLREQLHNLLESSAEDGYSHYYHTLKGLKGLRISPDQLAAYDLRIKVYVEQLNRFRSPPVQLKYFQYLAVLFSEIYLDHLFNNRALFIAGLNDFVKQENSKLPPGTLSYSDFTDADLGKLAFWMATGSGKTLIMHINLWQYQYYSQDKVQHDNILLVTPNEGLSTQHLKELRKSGVVANHYGETGGTDLFGQAPLTVIEITKLTQTKRGGGLTVEVDAFGPNNLLFVDEGHRGASGEVWRELRRRLAERGFTFEYSATFGQIVNGAGPDRRPELLEEYSKAVIYDYSYPHFYHDGYGKDYWITNLKDESNTFNQWMILGNLLSFHEQGVAYQEHREEFRPYNLERPLWVFVGHSVTGGKSRDDKASLTDVEEIIEFYRDLLGNRSKWIENIGKAINGQTGLTNRSGQDIFTGLFTYLKQKSLTPDEIYEGIIRQVFHGHVGDSLRAVELKAVPGEIGLRLSGDNPYFGVINIGDVAGLMKLFEGSGIPREDENITGSLFENINDVGSTVNVLIGSRKFMEGWDSFRVSSMGLMNIGKGEGSQIIQLFGRGVRLWGKGLSLKRSSALQTDGASPNMRLLETLNVFGVRANYMAQFRDYLRQEGIEPDYEELPLPIDVQSEFLKRELKVLRLPEGANFPDTQGVSLAVDSDIKITLDLRPPLEVAKSGENVSQAQEKVSGEDKAAYLRSFASILNWERIYFDLVKFKRTKNYYNLSFTQEVLKEIIEQGKYQVLSPNGQLPPTGYRSLKRVEDVAVAVLQKYTGAFYDRKRREWEKGSLRLITLTQEDPNLKFEHYMLRVRTSEKVFLEQVRELVKSVEEIYKKDVTNFPNIHFDRHLYQPLLFTDKQERLESTPTGLNEGEARFVKDLRAHLQKHRSQFADNEFFLLRNLTRGKGIGFFEAGGGEAFYPDFILWVIQDKKQFIAFIDPHGLRYAQGGFNDPKLQLHNDLKVLASALQPHCPDWKVTLTSFIISTSPYDKIAKAFGEGKHTIQEFEENHVLFNEDPYYVGKLLDSMTKCE